MAERRWREKITSSCGWKRKSKQRSTVDPIVVARRHHSDRDFEPLTRGGRRVTLWWQHGGSDLLITRRRET
ncbi:hypothetical protein E2542_SST10497 [Spatholobus suberectus]|nr:hypothetical protein E2542_SST10497 [Spatholobus suberectus]